MNFNIYNSVILAGIIQGFIFAIVVLLSKKYRAKSTLILTALIVTYSLGNLQYILADIEAMSSINMYKFIYLPLASIIPVLILFYVVKFLRPNAEIKHKLFWCLPFTIAMVITLYFRLQFLFKPEHDLSFERFSTFIKIHEVFSVFYALVLVTMAILYIRNFERKQLVFNRNYIRTDLKWLKYTLYFILLFTFIWAYFTYRNIFVEGDSPDFYLLWIGIAATIYWLGHIGIYKYGIIKERKLLRQFSRQAENSHFNSTYSKNKHIQSLNTLFKDEKLFLDPNLSLEKLAELLQLSSSYLSRIIHKELDTNFNEYVNSFRIEEAKRYLTNPDFTSYTITAIGLEAGFNSRSSFYEVFKKMTGLTPSVYKKQLIDPQKQ